MTDDYPHLLDAVLSPLGEPAARRERERALTLLLRDHPDRARADLLDAIRSHPTGPQVPAILEVLPFFGGSDTVRVLESLLTSEDPDIPGYAGIALGRINDPETKPAIERALSSPSPQATAAAADAAATTADPSHCSILRTRLTDQSPLVRYHVVHALISLNCLTSEERSTLAGTEPDPEVAGLLRW
ncbi:HEAT repeat domain-containing protein [Kribbella sp. CWNU-51]